jgi:hypothetical protein
MSELNDLVRDLQLAARKERRQGTARLLRHAAEFIWAQATQNEDEPVHIPCPDCGSTSTDCGCD